MVLRNKGDIVLVAFGGAVAGFLLTLGSPRIYQARTTLEIQGHNTNFPEHGDGQPHDG